MIWETPALYLSSVYGSDSIIDIHFKILLKMLECFT